MIIDNSLVCHFRLDNITDLLGRSQDGEKFVGRIIKSLLTSVNQSSGSLDNNTDISLA